MKIIFSDGDVGFHEAHELKKAIAYYANFVHDAHRGEILDRLEQLACEQMERPEYEPLRQDALLDDRLEEHRVSPLRSWLDAMLGPSAREQELAHQRIVALDRAQHAEAATFDAVAELARLESQLKELQKQLEEGAEEEHS